MRSDWWRHLVERIMWRLARMVPKNVRYYIVIDAWAKATTGKYSNTDATSITADEMVRRVFDHGAQA